MNLVKSLYERGYKRGDMLELFRFIDWLMVLPERLKENFKVEITRYEAAKKMRYVTSIERQAIQRGIEQSIEQGLLQMARTNVIEVLHLRFQSVPQDLLDRLQTITDPDHLKNLLGQAVMVGSVEEFERLSATGGA